MKQTLFQEKYPVFYFEVDKSETTFQSVPEIIAYFKEKVDAHPVAQYIGEFDHYNHTKQLEEGEIHPDILDAKHILFCFGIKLPTPRAMAVRPRSIGVCEMADHFVIDFLEAPMPAANAAMEEWTRAVRNKD
ncbi:DUF6858 family protein [Ectothiorhodospira mobilis]|uniref:DUF6858 family protein n=1 Tax=Ectothiorhodospira mobilis TaxID=195064 RepID=UPI001EE94BCE|nr:hypothetical protein [Ectothiorhodospira mobilis]MCG5536061.1 hypothetical protein [Ectothiorhodospira mobilis]